MADILSMLKLMVIFWLKKPKDLTSKQTMILGTAGITALQCSFATKTSKRRTYYSVKKLKM